MDKKKKRKKRLRDFLIFYFFIVVFTFANYTFSRYTATTNSETIIDVAKFNITVNEQILGQAQNFNVSLNTLNNTFNNKIVPDSEGNFEISINPDKTQVSLEYELTFDLSKINSDNRTISLISYSLDNGNTTIDFPLDNKIIGEINLKDNQKGFSVEDAVKITVYWEWKEDIVNPTFENTTISITSIIRQKL